jgi:hypothetical protein
MGKGRRKTALFFFSFRGEKFMKKEKLGRSLPPLSFW